VIVDGKWEACCGSVAIQNADLETGRKAPTPPSALSNASADVSPYREGGVSGERSSAAPGYVSAQGITVGRYRENWLSRLGTAARAGRKKGIAAMTGRTRGDRTGRNTAQPTGAVGPDPGGGEPAAHHQPI
jgi:hypothetical protein